MIVDKIENASLYRCLSEKTARAFEILKDNRLSEKRDGRYEVDGDNLYYIVQRYTTKPFEQGKLEAHKKYIDIQFVADGEELLGHSTVDGLETDVPYNEEKDVVFYEVPDKISTISLSRGTFCILFPHDAHMPGRWVDKPKDVLKIVIKVPVDEQIQ